MNTPEGRDLCSRIVSAALSGDYELQVDLQRKLERLAESEPIADDPAHPAWDTVAKKVLAEIDDDRKEVP